MTWQNLTSDLTEEFSRLEGIWTADGIAGSWMVKTSLSGKPKGRDLENKRRIDREYFKRRRKKLKTRARNRKWYRNLSDEKREKRRQSQLYQDKSEEWVLKRRMQNIEAVRRYRAKKASNSTGDRKSSNRL